jgi:hypothetical protein
MVLVVASNVGDFECAPIGFPLWLQPHRGYTPIWNKQVWEGVTAVAEATTPPQQPNGYLRPSSGQSHNRPKKGGRVGSICLSP